MEMVAVSFQLQWIGCCRGVLTGIGKVTCKINDSSGWAKQYKLFFENMIMSWNTDNTQRGERAELIQ